MKKRAIAVASAALYLGSASIVTQRADAAETGAMPQTIQVTGVGTVPVKPDIAIINLEVSSEDTDAQSAFTANNSATTKTLAELEAVAIDRNDIQTSNFPRPRIVESKRAAQYRVSNTIKVKIRSLEKLPVVLGKVVAAGSNSINGLTFSVSNPDKYLAEARKKASQDARVKAEAFTAGAGLTLGTVVSMIEEPIDGGRHSGELSFAAGYAAPIESGEENLQARVLVTFEIKPSKSE